ncbi:rhomboid family intramembrane serine protease [Lusitaniella coriacea LEGE 07157]|uniref:Rhomboid family intramembrane serine protease n=1 Tax=Lusitaniella coriacea LEGE 07157 TaxID=945747 RepID=A0A8J7DZE9_9CYAN|nr:rhomboid family intramembrane serine protease [Lusitaniella coriacea]MBE9118163.1 rhomboid family intramembrane serine protease [Lusitaniella coriacea LEGE 07157]
MSNPEEKSIANELQSHAIILGTFIAIFWIVEILDQAIFVGAGSLDQFGILPRTVLGLRGILFAPFLHGGWGHLIANTIPFAILGWLVMLQKTSDFFTVTAIAAVVGGLGTWLTGSPSYHIGASGLIYGYFGFLLLRGYYERNFASILLSLVVLFLYGGIIWGVLPTDPRISWQGHLFGLIGGVVAARFIGHNRRFQREIDKFKDQLNL